MLIQPNGHIVPASHGKGAALPSHILATCREELRSTHLYHKDMFTIGARATLTQRGNIGGKTYAVRTQPGA